MTFDKIARGAGALVAVFTLGALPVSTAVAQSAAPSGCTGPASGTWLNVVADGLRDGNGLLAITLYPDNSGQFLARHGSLYVGRVAAHAGSTRGCIYVPKPGVYAI